MFGMCHHWKKRKHGKQESLSVNVSVNGYRYEPRLRPISHVQAAQLSADRVGWEPAAGRWNHDGGNHRKEPRGRGCSERNSPCCYGNSSDSFDGDTILDDKHKRAHSALNTACGGVSWRSHTCHFPTPCAPYHIIFGCPAYATCH
eukprot:2738482-Amphidinium_carterae.1